MAVCGVGALGNARTVVEDRIGEYYQAIIQLKRQLNTMTLISRLPNEILSGIFVLVARICNSFSLEAKSVFCKTFRTDGGSQSVRAKAENYVSRLEQFDIERAMAVNGEKFGTF